MSSHSDLRRALRQALPLLSDAKLYQSAKWAAELLNAVPDPEPFATEPLSRLPPEDDCIILARTFFDCKEFDRCVHALKPCLSAEATFLRLYAMYLSGEAKKERSSETVLSAQDAGGTPNLQMSAIVRELEAFHKTNKTESAHTALLHYLHGVVLLKQKNAGAQEHLEKSVCMFPYNWSAWQELGATLATPDAAQACVARLQSRPEFAGVPGAMLQFFEVVLAQELLPHSPHLQAQLDELTALYPSFAFLKVQRALGSYHALDYAAAEELFDEILATDPLRLDDMDTYLNVLYVMEKRAKLSHLARFAASVDEFRPETCCVVANYHSLKGEHEKAIMYYRRALALNRRCLAAWTLMGHEFVELKNSHAAIEAYRRALDANVKDFRAWYGLGQAYEVLDMHLYALYYYQRAASLRPRDRRMWQAIAHCYEKLHKYAEAIQTYEKALGIDEDPLFQYKLATLYELVGDEERASEYMHMCLDGEANARLWLARYELKRGGYVAAYEYANEFGIANRGLAQDVEEARGIAREAKKRIV
ncbi:hypothetical protein BABINDRAFT_37150 [Babjeviella inositovora NRRL Y-12698]|uniref:Cdc23 domain-containing protein n=1 Tax=Babjeviella inositovora NRRL Y-12698 TaxID=984486 RepID=A0A1E3QR99_9ASCO|nr:uncharacterized protein BABINDRAFT_37150 [Babjeviella inositovora NRRL Y-12698]ODQ79582.1 hypothetical protein BABINDRAFT_37150 [Babjeviella inositovora NRRL Y-12698]